jgi:uncharacterized membrane protein YdjX (TVP38/TMEM64 family)
MFTRRHVGLGLALSALVALAVLASPDRVAAELRAALTWRWFPLLLIGLYLVRPVLGWPITVVSALVGFRYGLVVGVPVALGGCVLTSLPAFEAGRRLPTDGRILERLGAHSARYFRATGDLRGLVAARLAPAPSEPVSAAAGIGGLSLGTFALGTMLGEIPWTVAAVALGAGLQTFDPTRLAVDWRLVLLAGGGAVVLVGRPAYDAIRART